MWWVLPKQIYKHKIYLTSRMQTQKHWHIGESFLVQVIGLFFYWNHVRHFETWTVVSSSVHVDLETTPLNNCSLMGRLQSTQVLQQWQGRIPGRTTIGFQKRQLHSRNYNRRQAFYNCCHLYLTLEVQNHKKLNGWQPKLQPGINVGLKPFLFFLRGKENFWKVKIYNQPFL